MNSFAVVNGQGMRLCDLAEHSLVKEFAALYGCSEADAGDVMITLERDGHNLVCCWDNGDKKPLKLFINVAKFVHKLNSAPAARRSILNQAIGRKSQTVLDLTAGWGADALMLSSQGYQVKMIERHPLMALLLAAAMQRLSQNTCTTLSGVVIPTIEQADAVSYLSKLTRQEVNAIDCLYLDPMFPRKRKVSAAASKEMQFLQWLLAAQSDAVRLAESARDSAVRRVVIKRPHHASPLLPNPDARFSGKLVHYDVYMNHNSEKR